MALATSWNDVDWDNPANSSLVQSAINQAIMERAAISGISFGGGARDAQNGLLYYGGKRVDWCRAVQSLLKTLLDSGRFLVPWHEWKVVRDVFGAETLHWNPLAAEDLQDEYPVWRLYAGPGCTPDKFAGWLVAVRDVLDLMHVVPAAIFGHKIRISSSDVPRWDLNLDRDTEGEAVNASMGWYRRLMAEELATPEAWNLGEDAGIYEDAFLVHVGNTYRGHFTGEVIILYGTARIPDCAQTCELKYAYHSYAHEGMQYEQGYLFEEGFGQETVNFCYGGRLAQPEIMGATEPLTPWEKSTVGSKTDLSFFADYGVPGGLRFFTGD